MENKKIQNELPVRITLRTIVYFPQFVSQPNNLEYMYFQKEKWKQYRVLVIALFGLGETERKWTRYSNERSDADNRGRTTKMLRTSRKFSFSFSSVFQSSKQKMTITTNLIVWSFPIMRALPGDGE
jgi:hypothetical protein